MHKVGEKMLKIKRWTFFVGNPEASKSRWCCVFKNYPVTLMTESSIWIPGDEDNE